MSLQTLASFLLVNEDELSREQSKTLSSSSINFFELKMQKKQLKQRLNSLKHEL